MSQEPERPRKSIPTISAETEVLFHLISKLIPGELLTYDAMSKSIGFEIRKKRGPLRSARRKARNENRITTVTVKNEGIRRAAGMEYCDVVTQATIQTGRKLRNAVKDSVCMPEEEYNALQNSEKIQLNLRRSQAGAMAEFTKPKTIKRLTAVVEKTGTRIPALVAYRAQLEKNSSDENAE